MELIVASDVRFAWLALLCLGQCLQNDMIRVPTGKLSICSFKDFVNTGTLERDVSSIGIGCDLGDLVKPQSIEHGGLTTEKSFLQTRVSA